MKKLNEDIKKNNKEVLSLIKNSIIKNNKLTIHSTNFELTNQKIEDNYDLYRIFTLYFSYI